MVMRWQLSLLIAAIIGLVILVSAAVFYWMKRSKHDACTAVAGYKMQGWIINMDKNEYRMSEFQKSYGASDLNQHMNIHRFPAIVGAEVDPSDYLSENALAELHATEERGYRTHHHQLSRGGIGCFLSHYTLIKRLAQSSDDCNAFLIFEDDIKLPLNFYETLTDVLKDAPKDWDVMLLGYHRVRGDALQQCDKFYKVNGFWGLFGYLISKEGACKFVKQVEDHRVDAQVDIFISYLSHIGELNTYAVKNQIVHGNDEMTTSDVQFYRVNDKEDDYDSAAMVYKGFLL